MAKGREDGLLIYVPEYMVSSMRNMYPKRRRLFLWITCSFNQSSSLSVLSTDHRM